MKIIITDEQAKTIKMALIEYAKHNVDNAPNEQKPMYMIKLINKLDN